MTRISKAPEERRREFLESAKKLFSQKGYEKTSVSDIVMDVGVAQGLFYYYFKSKQDCFECVVEEEVNRCLEQVRSTADQIEDPIERVRMIFQMMLEYLERLDTLTESVSHKTRERFGELEERICTRVMREATKNFASIIEYGNERGTFHCVYPLPTAQMITMGLLTLMMEQVGKAKEILMEYEPVVQDLCGRLLGVEFLSQRSQG